MASQLKRNRAPQMYMARLDYISHPSLRICSRIPVWGIRKLFPLPSLALNDLLHHRLHEPKCTLNFRGSQVMLPGVVDGLEEHRVGVLLVAVLSPHPPVHSRG